MILLWTVFHSVSPGVDATIDDDDDDGATKVQTNFDPSQNINFVTIFTIIHPGSFYNTKCN